MFSGDFGVSEDHSRNDDFVQWHAVFAVDTFDGNVRLFVRLVRQQNAAGDVANGVNVRVIRLLAFVDFDKPFFVQFHLCVFQT